MNSKTSREEILTKAIGKAVDGGWIYPNHTPDTIYHLRLFGHVSFAEYIADRLEDEPINEIYSVIYDKDFAKAIWGEETNKFGFWNKDKFDGYVEMPNWQYHLRQMVVADDAIAYLGDNI